MKQKLCDTCHSVMTEHDQAFMQRPHRLMLDGGPVTVKFTAASAADACASCLVGATLGLATAPDQHTPSAQPDRR